MHATPLGADELRDLGWCRIISPARTAWDLCAWHDALTAVLIVEALIGRIPEQGGRPVPLECYLALLESSSRGASDSPKDPVRPLPIWSLPVGRIP